MYDVGFLAIYRVVLPYDKIMAQFLMRNEWCELLGSSICFATQFLHMHLLTPTKCMRFEIY